VETSKVIECVNQLLRGNGNVYQVGCAFWLFCFFINWIVEILYHISLCNYFILNVKKTI